MLPAVLAARDKWLAPGGVVMPSRATMQICASAHSELTFWEDVYGYDMVNVGAAMGEDKLADVLVVPPASALSEQVTFRTIDIMTVTDEELDFNASFELVIIRDGILRTFIGSFETIFEPPVADGQLVELKTGMADPPTHWKQTLFHVKEPTDVKATDSVRGLIAVARLGEGRRDLDVSITWSVVGADGQVRVKERSQLWQV
jgi:protein arginine N-methyltransferase 1